VRWGVAGCGQIAVDRSIPGILAAQGARLVAIADPLPPRRQLALDLAARAGIADVTAHADSAGLFADPRVEAVYLALPTGDHAGAVRAAAAAGKAILCEKPLGRSTAEVRAMVDATRRHGVPLATGYMSRFSDVFRKAAELVQAGALGQVTYVAGHFSYPCLECYPPGAPGGWRWTDPVGGGPLLDIGIYLAFGLREILAQRIARVWPVNCDTLAPAGAAVRDTTAAAFVTDQGTPGTFVTSFTHSASTLSFFGTTGSMVVTDVFRQTPGALLVAQGRGLDLTLDTRADAALPVFDNYRREFEHFSAALREGRAPRPTPDEVLEDTLLLDALRRNAAPLDVPRVPSS